MVAGGATRQDSVRAGLEALPAAFDGIVLVHDAARALIEPALIASVVRAAVAQRAIVKDAARRSRPSRRPDTDRASPLGGGAPDTLRGVDSRTPVSSVEGE